MSRLLFAAARGARIQWLRSDGAWITPSHPVPRIGPNKTYPWRIHPDDEHLQYGPISSALREFAETGELAEAGVPCIHGYFDMPAGELSQLAFDAEHRSLFLLILSEALADSGL